MNNNIFKSIGAVLAGMVVIVAFSICTDMFLQKMRIYPAEEVHYATWMLLLALVYRSIYTVAGAYVTAILAPQNPMKHVIILGCIGTALSIVGVIVGWNLSEHWYPIALAITTLPLAWLGGKLKRDPSFIVN